jgi:pimeloyl-ACP methyl ester carboxylesterase
MPAPEASRTTVLHRACALPAWVVLHPWRLPPVVTPRAVGLDYERVTLHSGGVRLAAWHVPRAGATAGIVLCHGHDNCRMQVLHLLRPLHEAGFHLFLFDHRTMGVSGGRHCTYGHHEHRDTLAAVEWLRGAGVRSVGLYGISMGAATALLAAAADPQIAAVVSDCAFARLEEVVERRFGVLPAHVRGPVSESVRQWAEGWSGVRVGEVDPEAAVRSWRPRPLLIIHGTRDGLIPVEHGRRLAIAAGEQAEYWEVPGAFHARSRRKVGKEYDRRVAEFFSIHL